MVKDTNNWALPRLWEKPSGANSNATLCSRPLPLGPSEFAAIRRASSLPEQFGFPRMCGSLFFLHEAQIADNSKQPLSDGRFGVAGKIEKRIQCILVRLHLR